MQRLHEITFWRSLVKNHTELDGGIDQDEQQEHQPMQGNQWAAIFERVVGIHGPYLKQHQPRRR